MSSDYEEVLLLVSALAKKIAESTPELSPQAIGAALYGLQKLSSDAPQVIDSYYFNHEHNQVRTLVSALAEKVEISTVGLDAQAIGNALFGNFILLL